MKINPIRLLPRFSAAGRENRLLDALYVLGETGAFELMRATHLAPGSLYPILTRWERAGMVASRLQEDRERDVADDGTMLPARRLYRLAISDVREMPFPPGDHVTPTRR